MKYNYSKESLSKFPKWCSSKDGIHIKSLLCLVTDYYGDESKGTIWCPMYGTSHEIVTDFHGRMFGDTLGNALIAKPYTGHGLIIK